MKCSYFHEHLDQLFDNETPESQRQEISLHMEECPACNELYRQSAAALRSVTPRCEIHAPAALRDRILREATGNAVPALNDHRTLSDSTPTACAPKSRKHLRLWPQLATAAAVILAALLLFNPVGRYRVFAASRMFANASLQFGHVPLYMEIEVRTHPAQNFAFIDTDLPFVTHRMWVEPGSLGRWRLEKPGRIASYNGLHTLLWNPVDSTGAMFNPDHGVIEDFSVLLDPTTLLGYEEKMAVSNKEVRYCKQVTDDAILLTVEAPAQGDFTHDDMRNTSITESDTRREYRFDRQTGRLEALKIDILHNGEMTTIARLDRIVYDAPVPDTLFTTPEGVVWNDLTAPAGGAHFADITPEQAVRRFFEALDSWDEQVLGQILGYYSLDEFRPYAGSRLIEVEPAYRSGLYPGVFVRCMIETPDGKQERLRLALRNDNPSQAWVLDGGW